MANARTSNDWTTEEAYWRKNFNQRPYVESGRSFDYYQPAYRFGYEARERLRGRDVGRCRTGSAW